MSTDTPTKKNRGKYWLYGLGTFVVLAIIGRILGPPAPSAPPKPVTIEPPQASTPAQRTVAATEIQVFEASAFCREFGCTNHQSWPLKVGGMNHSYRLKSSGDAGVEVPTTNDNHIASYGISFRSEDNRLGTRELGIVDTFLHTIDANAATPAVRQFVRQNVERPVFQIRKARSTTFGRYRLWAGKVGNDQIVSIEPIAAPSPLAPTETVSSSTTMPPPSASKGAAHGTTAAAAESVNNRAAFSTMVSRGLIKRMDLKTGKFYISGDLWEGFELDAKQNIVRVISEHRNAEQGLPQVTLYDSRSGRELATYGAFSGVTIR